MSIQQLVMAVGGRINDATGGTITYNGDYQIHTFTSSGTFTVTRAGLSSTVVDVLVAAGMDGLNPWLSTRYIADHAHVCAVNSIVSELRAAGLCVTSRCVGRGRHEYRLNPGIACPGGGCATCVNSPIFASDIEARTCFAIGNVAPC